MIIRGRAEQKAAEIKKKAGGSEKTTKSTEKTTSTKTIPLKTVVKVKKTERKKVRIRTRTKLFVSVLAILLVAIYYYLQGYDPIRSLLDGVIVVGAVAIIIWLFFVATRNIGGLLVLLLKMLAFFGGGLLIVYAMEYTKVMGYTEHAPENGISWFFAHWFSLEGLGWAIGYALCAYIIITLVLLFLKK